MDLSRGISGEQQENDLIERLESIQERKKTPNGERHSGAAPSRVMAFSKSLGNSNVLCH
jgi:hypothetical protein